MKTCLSALLAALVIAPGFSPSGGEKEERIMPLEMPDRILVKRAPETRRQPAFLGYDHGTVEQDFLLKSLYDEGLTPLNILDPSLLVMPAGYKEAPNLWHYPLIWSRLMDS